MTRHRWSVFAPVLLALALVAGACGGDGDDPKAVGEKYREIRETEAADVEPPERVNAKRVGLPGLILDTNSVTWQRLLDARREQGAVVLFVQPAGPSDRKGLARGDVITKIDGERVTNDETALALLWGVPGEAKKLTVHPKRGKEREIEVKPARPTSQPRIYLDVMIDGNPTDPVLRYVRAQTSGGKGFDANLNDFRKALAQEPRFVEALVQQGSLMFNQRRREKDSKKRSELAARALSSWRNALDLDPRNAEALALQAVARTALGFASAARADALRAVQAAPSLPVANYSLAVANLSLKKPADSAGPARAAIEGNPFSNLTYYRTLARAFKGLKRKEDCQQTLLAIIPWLEGTKAKALQTEAKQIEKEAREGCD